MNDDRIVNIADESRPLTFSDVVGQVFAQGVGKRIGSGRISGQGYILSGPKGCGKTSVARIIARSVNCQNRDTGTGDPCNTCPSCQLALQDAHPYIQEVNAASQRGINEIKDVISTMNLAVREGMRVYILDEVHMLTREAFSVLLKPMENPPANVIFIATTTNPEAIPDTIVSRVPVIPINPLSDDDIRHVLHRVVETNLPHDTVWGEVTEEDYDHAVLSAQGSARQAITTLSGVVFHGVTMRGERNHAKSIAKNMISGDVRKTLDCAMEACQDKATNPVSLVQAIMDNILGCIPSSTNPRRLARQVADLSVVARSLSSSTPALMVSSSIASCVSPMDDQSKPGSAAPNNATSNTGMLTVTGDTTVDDILDHLLTNTVCTQKLGRKWVDVLDSYDKSDVSIDQGVAVIKVFRPTEQFRTIIKSLVSPVKVVSL